MDWIHNFQLFLFDFDGLLVNTEELHYRAYIEMCKGRGFQLDWNFDRYCSAAHYDAETLRNRLYEYFPQLKVTVPQWDILYHEKKKAFMDLLGKGAVTLMPGAEKLLIALENAKIKRCVVTHSSTDIVNFIRKQNPILNTIPTWFTREDYTHPKPHPECYLKAIHTLANPKDNIIGFEDTPRGLKALQQTCAQPVLICTANYPDLSTFLQNGVLHYPSLGNVEMSTCSQKR